MKKNILGIVVIGCLSLPLQSCLVAVVGAAVGAVKYGNAKKSEAESECKKAYNDYLDHIEKLNASRSKSHQKTEKMMTLEEYCKKKD